MKRGAIFFVSLFLISIVSAIPSLEFQHEETQPGETILAAIKTTGEFSKQIISSDIIFLEGRKQVFFESDITFHENTHYLYIYTTRQGNFSIQIPNILYKESGELKSTTITKPFEILEKIYTGNETNQTTTEILSIKPGFIFSAETPKLKLTNKGTEILNLKYRESELSLQPQETQQITHIPSEKFSYLNISSYKEFSIPIIYLLTNITPEPSLKQLDLKHNPDLLLAKLFTSIETQKTIELFNFGDENITDIEARSDFSFIRIEDIENMPPRGTQNITIIFNPKISQHFQGNINITYIQNEESHKISIPISLFILPQGSTPEDFKIQEETCEEKSGIVCQAEEICDGSLSFTKNAESCCLGTCHEITEETSITGSYGWIIALIIFIALGAGGYYLYTRQKKTQAKKPEEKLKEASEKFEERMKKTPETKKVKDSLTK